MLNQAMIMNSSLAGKNQHREPENRLTKVNHL